MKVLLVGLLKLVIQNHVIQSQLLLTKSIMVKEDSYFSTPNGKERTYNDAESTNIGLRAWWRPEETGTAVPSISVGYDVSETAASANSQTDMYFVGLQWQDMFSADDRIGLAFGQPQKREDETTDPFAWEAYYQYQVNDSVSITPAVFGGAVEMEQLLETLLV